MAAGMIVFGASNLMNVLRRVGLSLGCLLLSVVLFSLLFSLRFGAGAVLLVFRVTLIVALPVWCLYLPFLIALKDAEERRIWIILFSGILIGPTSLALLGLIFQLRGVDPHKIWQGDPLLGVLGGLAAMMIYALIVGFLTTSFYVIVLRALHRRSTAIKG
jgi:hypothetical protein